MKTERSKKKAIIQIVAKAMIQKDIPEWPPGCGTLLYQPMRPKRQIPKKV